MTSRCAPDGITVEAWQDTDGRLYAFLPVGQYEADGTVVTVHYGREKEPVLLGIDEPPEIARVHTHGIVVTYLDRATGQEVPMAEYMTRLQALRVAKDLDPASIEARHVLECYQHDVVPLHTEQHETRTRVVLSIRHVPLSGRACITPLRSLAGDIVEPSFRYVPPLREMLDAASAQMGVPYDLSADWNTKRELRFLKLVDCYVDWDDPEIKTRAASAGIGGEQCVVRDYVGTYENCVAQHDGHVAFLRFLFELYRGVLLRERRLEDVLNLMERAAGRLERLGDTEARTEVIATFRDVLAQPTASAIHDTSRLRPRGRRRRR